MVEGVTELNTYEETLERCALGVCSGFVRPLPDDEMDALYQRRRAIRSKLVTVIGTVTVRSLHRAWTAFVEMWNTEGREAFTRTLEAREVVHQRLSVGTLASSICSLSWEADCFCCYVHYREGCRSCHESVVSETAWRHTTQITLFPETELREIGSYQEALHKARCGVPPRCLEDLHQMRGVLRTPPRSSKCPQQEPTVAPSYRASARASGQYIGGAQGHLRRGAARRSPVDQVVLKIHLNDVSNIARAIHKRDRTIALKLGDAPTAQRLDRLARRMDQL
ncbi:LOW QUALITY PROTEIN: hypothetical protein PHMEG_00037748 [Phytophthora megakarya]|uniref:Uncharacterized protein n=1 Tax=Phytophthora megakarya TaxID=4795 RepID=A0A225UKD0_9STRA|nr:LOW QUALITY PROTEIN: hypothetical protein PHMEG_00037748 [Phytophthora megakarya]